ncbi:M56 family metallopeptidase [Paucibacter sp. R3-3]|uniref:M56 family metallopeptidase n=1 Tax=Roseateles agri TaxID=3098619 RepID=A0ABU5DD46_9BURK|nr:M56 family metallopeptidase [Paucibacter sp. R3-3]MDY0744054.1 M56 family metallopeptidase [Paucibacter sp. R3-3]
MLIDSLSSLLLNYLLHSSVLLGLALAAERTGLLRRLAPALQETVWRWALFGGLLTAALQPLLGAVPAKPASAPIVVSAPSNAQPATDDADKALPLLPAPQAQVAAESPVRTLKPWQLQATGALTALWLLGAGSGLALLLLRWLWLARLVRRMPLSGDGDLARFAADTAGGIGIRPPTLRSSARWTSPLLAPGRNICLPLWLDALSLPQREAVLAHELAHLLRRDPAWRLAGQALASIAWLQPLNHLALRRLDTLAELACDDWAARLSGDGRALAESLYFCAQQHQQNGHSAPTLATAMSGRQSPLLQRMRSLLEKDTTAMTPDSPVRTRSTRWLIAGGVLLAALILPAIVVRNVQAEGASMLSKLGRHLPSLGSSSVTRIETDEAGGRLKIQLDGTVQFTAAGDDILSLNGSLDIEDQRGGKTRHLAIRSDGKSALQRVFQRDGKTLSTLEADDRRWQAEVMAALIDAMDTPEQRVERLIQRGGVEAVLRYVEAPVHGDYPRRSTLEALLARGPLQPVTVDRVLAMTRTLGDDFDTRSALQALASSQTLSEAQQLAYLQAAGAIDSAFDRREALLALSSRLEGSSAVLQAWVTAVSTIHSDFDARTALEGLLEKTTLTPAHLDAALQAADSIGSDFDRRTALQAIAPRLDASHPAQYQAYAESAARVGGAFDRREALVTLLDQKGLDKNAYLAVLKAIEGIGSSFDLAEVLQATAEHMPADAALIARYRQLARGLSDVDRGRAERALDRLAPAA